MNKKIYKAINQFMELLSSAEDSWTVSSDTMDRTVKTLKVALAKAGISGTDDEVCETLLRFAAALITNQDDQQDNYPTINFVETT